jgi:hypothetical protein
MLARRKMKKVPLLDHDEQKETRKINPLDLQPIPDPSNPYNRSQDEFDMVRKIQ